MRRYDAYSATNVDWLGDIPASWSCANLGVIARQRKNLNKDGDVESVLSLSYGKIKRRVMDNSGLLPESFNTYNVIESGDVVLRLTDLQNDQRSLRVGLCHERGIITAAYVTLEPTAVNSRYLYYSLAVFDFWKGFYGLVGGVRQSLTFDGIRNLRFPLPSKGEQIAIADYLDAKTAEIDVLMADCEREVELLQEYRKAVISEVVTKGLDPTVAMKDSGIEWIGEIPKEWGIENLGGHSTMLTPMRDKPVDLSGPIPWIRIEDYDGKYISSSKEDLGVSAATIEAMNLKIYPIGTLLCTSSCDLGKCAIVAKELVSNQRFIGIIPTDYNVDYLYYLMLSNAERLNFLSTGTIQANLSRKAFEHLKLPYPPFAEQRAIADYLDAKTAEIDSLITDKCVLADKLREYRKSLVSEAVTGKFKVPGV